MKKKLLFLMTTVIFSVTYLNAQITKTWVFANATDWPTSSTYYATNRTIQELNLIATDQTVATPVNPIMTNRTSPVVTFADGFTAARVFRFNGSSLKADKTAMLAVPASSADYLPAYRYLSLSVSGPFTVKIWFTSGAGSTRNIRVTDGTQTLAADMSSLNSTDAQIFTATANYTGTVYIACANTISAGGGLDIFKIELTTQSLGINDIKANVSSDIFSNGKEVFVSNVKSTTKIDVYAITGALIKSLTTESDTSINLKSGLYIVKLNSAEGVKTSKIIIE